MKLSVKFLRLNEYTHCDDEVSEGTQYGFWRIVEHTGAGWFPWDGLWSRRDVAEDQMHIAMRRDPETDQVWTDDIRRLWRDKILPKFAKGEWCSSAHFFKPRPYVDEYNRASPYEGFTYVVQPGNRVCMEQWIPE